MNSKALNFIKNMSYTISSNLLTLIVSTLVVLIIPKLIGVEEYGYWQLYIFYSSYVGFLHFGWNDGIYLKYGGENYDNLDKQMFFSQFIQLLVSQITIGMIIWIISLYFLNDPGKSFILSMVAITTILVNTRLMFFLILQATNRIREYARITILDRLVYVLLLVILLLFGIKDFKIMIFADLFGKFVSLLLSMWVCKDIVFNKISSFKLSVSETINNINVGIKLMFSNIAGMLIIGIVRFGIERKWDVTTFGKVSLTLSISNMMMIFINAVGIIMFPVLRRTKYDKLADIYSVLRDILMAFLLGVLIFYYPFKLIMSEWLPHYADSLIYMALAFPMFIFEGKMALLINTYLKTLRQEKVMLKINIISMVISLVLTFIATNILNNLNLAIVNIVFLLALRSTIAEIYLSNKLDIYVIKDVLMELLLIIVFITSGWFYDSWLNFFIYLIAYCLYLLIKKKNLINSFNKIKVYTVK